MRHDDVMLNTCSVSTSGPPEASCEHILRMTLPNGKSSIVVNCTMVSAHELPHRHVGSLFSEHGEQVADVTVEWY